MFLSPARSLQWAGDNVSIDWSLKIRHTGVTNFFITPSTFESSGFLYPKKPVLLG
jgi:hypothetical protein